MNHEAEERCVAVSKVVIVADSTRVVRESELLAEYERAGSIRQVCAAFGLPYVTVHRHLKAAGAELGRSHLVDRVRELEEELHGSAR